MKNQRIIKILSIIIICLSLITIISIAYIKYKDRQMEKESVVNKIENVKQPLLYFTSSYETACATCKNMDMLMNYYNEQYNLKYYTYNVDREKLSVEEFLKTYDFTDSVSELPILGLMKDDIVYSLMQGFSNEPALYQYLIDNKLIIENKNETIVTLEQEKSIINGNQVQIFFVGEKNPTYYKERKKVLKYLEGTDYNIKILANGYDYFSNVLETPSDSCNTVSCETSTIDNYLLKVQNGKVIDKLNDFSKEKVLEFMKS